MNQNANCCRLDIPYPPIKTEGECLSAAALLSNDLAGQVSEMSAINTYVFQHMICCDESLANALKCISMVEMHHFEMIGELIVCFGGCPRQGVQCGCGIKYWSAQNLCWEADPACFLSENIKNERAAIANYTARITQINDACVKRVLERIILDEEHHIEIFNSFLNRLGNNGRC